MPRTEWGWQITEAELRSWVLYEDADLLAINKPAHVLCHRSKHGPWSSLISACWDYTGIRALHMPTRLDRETSGVVVVTKTREVLELIDRAARARQIRKAYCAILHGILENSVTVEAAIGKAAASAVASRRAVMSEGKHAVTRFEPLEWSGNYTFARVTPLSGRTHQIRVHAAHLGHWIAGDKIYGPDERLFLEFLETGWTPRLQDALGIERQALHAMVWAVHDRRFIAPLPEDWRPFAKKAGFNWEQLVTYSRMVY
jgi:23S rRNA pseudouridine1911/1915/1917 synthase